MGTLAWAQDISSQASESMREFAQEPPWRGAKTNEP
jgi:hypothetical protein